MKIGRIPKDAHRGPCHSCHGTAAIVITLSSFRPEVRICLRCARYAGGVLLSRVGEAEAGIEIPAPGQRVSRQVHNTKRYTEGGE